MDQPDAAMPALTGHRDQDWTAFAAVYQKVTSQLHASPDQRQELAAATMTGMIASLHDNHARWSYPAPPPGDMPGDLGYHDLTGAPAGAYRAGRGAAAAIRHDRAAGSPAARNGLRPGDIIVSVNGAPPFTNGAVSEGVINLLLGPDPRPGRVTVQLKPARHRPHLDGDPDTRALPGLSACGIREAAERKHRLRAAARVLPRLARPSAGGDNEARPRAQSCAGSSWTCAATAAATVPKSGRLLGGFIHGAA